MCRVGCANLGKCYSCPEAYRDLFDFSPRVNWAHKYRAERQRDRDVQQAN